MNLELAYKREVLIGLMEGPPENHLGRWKEQDSVDGLRGEGELEHCVELSHSKRAGVFLCHTASSLYPSAEVAATFLSKPAWAPCPVSRLGSIFCGWLLHAFL